MKLVSYVGGYGRVDGDFVHPLGDHLVRDLTHGPDRLGVSGTAEPVSLGSLQLRAPVPEPGKIICVGLNYRDHAKEAGKELPTEPILFAKFANSVTAHEATVRIPAETAKADYEGELAVVISRRATRVSEATAIGHVAGYTVANDLSARDLQWSQGQWTRGKAIDDFLPMGPWLVTPDEVGDPHSLGIRTYLNNDVVQDSTTAELIFGVGELIAFVSRTITLEPGDVILTGTPPGVGFARTPPRFLHAGDEVVVEIERIGRLVTRMAA